MRSAIEIKKPTETKVIVDETVSNTFRAYNGLKRHLQHGKHFLQPNNHVFIDATSMTTLPAQDLTDGQKFFLHQSVSRYKPRLPKLKQWAQAIQKGPKVKVGCCVITLAQPFTKRPAKSFRNPMKDAGKHSVNDALGYPVVLLLANQLTPQREQDEASHLCGHKRCINIDHLVWESTSVNFSRNECHHYNEICAHVPRCLPHRRNERTIINKHILAAQGQSSRKKRVNK